MTRKVPLVLVPGLLCTGAVWRHQETTFADIAEVIVPDVTRHDRIAGMARAILEEAPPRFALAGLSMGAYVAIEIVRQAPERVLKLALIGGSARGTRPEQAEQRRAQSAQARAEGGVGGAIGELMPCLLHPDRLHEPELVSLVTRMAHDVGVEGFERQQEAIIHQPDRREELAGIACETAIVVGRQDAVTPPKIAAEMAERIPGSRMVIIEDCGHLSPIERPHALSAVLRYWLG